MGYAHGALTDYSGDSAQYLGIATRAPWSSDFLLASKPWTVPLLYKLAGGRLHAGYAQFAASIASWLALAAVAAAIVRERRVGIAAAVLVLLFSLSIWITQWDKLVLSESLSVSLAAAAVAAWMALVTWPRALTLAAALAITLLWVFTRDTNAYVLLFALAPLAVWLVRSSQTRRIAAIALVGAAAVAAASLESASAGQGCFESGSPVRFEPSKHAALAARGFCVRRWYTLVNTIGVRIVPDSQARSYFVARGMPVPPLMRRLSGQLLGIVPNTYSDPSMAGFVHAPAVLLVLVGVEHRPGGSLEAHDPAHRDVLLQGDGDRHRKTDHQTEGRRDRRKPERLEDDPEIERLDRVRVVVEPRVPTWRRRLPRDQHPSCPA